jgi:hypothetical protein
MHTRLYPLAGVAYQASVDLSLYIRICGSFWSTNTPLGLSST